MRTLSQVALFSSLFVACTGNQQTATVVVTNQARTGFLRVYPDTVQLFSIAISGPQTSTIERWTNGSSQDGVVDWSRGYVDGAEQWVGAVSGASGEFVSPLNATTVSQLMIRT